MGKVIKMSGVILISILLGLGVTVYGADFFVAKERGDNQNPGTKAAPFKNIEAALKVAKSGDKIFVAQGNYFGLRDKGYLEIPQAVELFGGYSADFSKRDVEKYPTGIIPDRESGASGRKPLVSVVNVPAGATFVLDGFILDRGAQNAYSPKDGVIEGLGGRLLRATEKPTDGPSTVEEPLLCFTNKVNARIEGELIIRNCVFLNGHFAIQGGFKNGSVKILNNIFAANKMAAIEVFGTGGKKGPKGPIEKSGQVEIAHNTILFTVDPDGTGPAPSFTFADPDFNFKSLRGTVVFRWEYRPGSTLYFVWTQNRQDFANPGDFDFGRDVVDLVSARGDNVFMLKATYRFNL